MAIGAQCVVIFSALFLGGCTAEQARDFSEGYNQSMQQQRSAPASTAAKQYDPTAKTKTVIATNEACTSDVACGYGKICASPAQDWRVTGTCISPVTKAGAAMNVQQGGTVHKISGCEADGDCSGWNQQCVVKN